MFRRAGCETCHEIGETPGNGNVPALHANRRDGARGETDAVVAHRHSHKDTIDGFTPGVRRKRLRKSPPGSLGTVQTPPHVGNSDPVGDRADRIVVELESAAYDAKRDELQHLGGRKAARHEGEQRVQRCEHRERLAKGTVGDAVGEPRGCLLRLARGIFDRRAETRLHERCELVDSRREDDDVLLAKARVLVEQMEDRVTQHLHLAVLSMTGVHLD